MLYVDTPSQQEFRALNAMRADACVSIYVPTTPVTSDIGASRIEYGNLVKEALRQLEEAKLDKRRLAQLKDLLDELGEDDDYWRLQAHSLAVLATPDGIRTFRLANRLRAMVEVADRYHLKPLLRAITFPHEAFVLALSENGVRLVEVFADLPPVEIKVPGLPKDAASAAGKSTLNDRTGPLGRIQGSEGQKVRLGQYLRKIDAALRPILAGRDMPLVLAATDPLASLYRSMTLFPQLQPDIIRVSPDRLSDAELASATRPVLDAAYARELERFRKLFEQRGNQNRTTGDLSDAARAATFGAIEMLLVDIDNIVDGVIDEQSGAITFADKASAGSYGIVDEIAGRALASGAKVLGVRRDDIPGGGELAAVLRFPL